MASDIFLKLDGITGESTDGEYKDQIEIESFGFSADQSSSIATSGSGGFTTARVSLGDLSIAKQLDKSSAALFHYCTTGKKIASAVLNVCGANEKRVVYLRYELTNVVVSSVSTSSSGDGMRPMESISLRFSKIVMTYNPTENTGKVNPANIATWDAATNKPE